MLRNAPVPRNIALADLIERVRIVCTVYDPQTGQYRYNYSLIIEIAGALPLPSMVWFFLAEWRDRRRRKREAMRHKLALSATNS